MPDESLFVCKKVESETRIEPFSVWGALARKAEIDQSLLEEDELTPSERMLRGDFDA